MLRIIALTGLILLAVPAAAQVTGALPPAAMALGKPKLKELVVVSTDVVRIGDLVENAGPTAGIAVFRSPDLGYTGGVPLARVMEALAPYRIAALDTGSITEVVVTRASRAITPKDIEARIAQALAGQHGFSDARNISINFDRELRALHVEPTATGELQVTRLNVDPRTGQFSATLELPGSMVARRLPLRFGGTATETIETAVLARPINRGDVIKASDITIERRPKAELSGDIIGAKAAVGFAAKRLLLAGSVLRQSDFMKPEVVQRNEAVTISYEVPGLLVTVRGKALEAGAAGDIISVLNLQSNRTVQASVMAPGRVSVAATARAPSNTGASASEPSDAARPTTE
jgi:flagella basal body P-ring formation protein FlgA